MFVRSKHEPKSRVRLRSVGEESKEFGMWNAASRKTLPQKRFRKALAPTSIHSGSRWKGSDPTQPSLE